MKHGKNQPTQRNHVSRRSRSPQCGLEPLENRRLMAAFEVTNLLATGAGSLRQAVTQANALAGADTITFAANLSGGTIALTGGQIIVSEALTIDARALPQNVTIDAAGESRILGISATTGNFTVAGLTFHRGKTLGNLERGGGLISASSGTLTIDRCTFTYNQTFGIDADGGAVSSIGPINMSNSTVSNNLTAGINSGGGGIHTPSGLLTLTRSTVNANGTTGTSGLGGAMQVGSANISQSTIHGNVTNGQSAAAGGVFSVGALTITDSTLSGNITTGVNAAGGAIANSIGSVVTITRSTISGNRTDQFVGGGIFAEGPLLIEQSTITDNSALSQTQGGAIHQHNTSSNFPLTINNSIVAGNRTSTGANNDVTSDPGSTWMANYSLFGPGFSPDTGTGFVIVEDPMLAPLANNGGATQTHRLLPGSPALDAGDPSIATSSQLDQRGAPFLRVFDNDGANGARIDMGALESQQLIVTSSSDVVDQLINPGFFSLREAINVANTMDEARITFGVTGNITLAGTMLPGITKKLKLEGPGAGQLSISGNGVSGIIDVAISAEVELSGVTLTNGLTSNGAAVNNRGMLTVADSMLTNSTATFGGGAIINSGNLTVIGSTIANNTSRGGAIATGLGSTLTVINSTFSGNSANQGGGAIRNFRGTATIINSTLTGNNSNQASSELGGGGIWTFYDGVVGTTVVNNSIVANNTGGNVGGPYTGSNNLLGTVALGPLADNGGPTLTHAIPSGSPAVDGGDDQFIPEGINTDQRGFGRRYATVDIGAVELQEFRSTSASFEVDHHQPDVRFVINNWVDDATVSGDDVVVNALLPGGILGTAVPVEFDLSMVGSLLYGLPTTLADGHYRATLKAGSIADEFGNLLAADRTIDFAFLRGDANGDLTVNISDFAAVASNFNEDEVFYRDGDFNYDDRTDISDFAILASKFNTSLPEARTPVMPAGSRATAPGRVFSTTPIPTDRLLDVLN